MKWLLLALLLAALLAPLPARADDDPLRAPLQSLHAEWYDAERDTWRAVDVRPPPPPPSTWTLPGGALLVNGIAWLLAALLLVALAALVWQVRPPGMALPQPQQPQQQPVRARPGTLADLALDTHGDPEAALAQAKAAAEWARAVVWLYAILLLQLDRAGVVRVRRGATNQRYRQEVAGWADAATATPVLLPTVDAAIAAFERVYFGQQPADAALVAALETQIRAALAALTEAR